MDLSLWAYVQLAWHAVFIQDPALTVLGLPLTTPVLMTAAGLVLGIVVGAIPGLSGPFAMAVSLPLLIASFGFDASALLPVLGFLIGIMKGATVGGAVPAILFNTPGTPDAMLTTFDGHPMALRGQASKALRVAHLSSVSGDTFSDLVLITSAPFLALLVERYLGFPEKAALIILSLAFIAAVVGHSVIKGLLAACLGMLLASIARGEDSTPRLTGGWASLAGGIPLEAAVLGVLILGEVMYALLNIGQRRRAKRAQDQVQAHDEGDQRLHWHEAKALWRFILPSACIGTVIGALPGIGSTMAATLGRALAVRRYRGQPPLGQGAPAGIAATEAANSAVAGANLIPVLSLGIPGNVAAVFLLLAMESIGGLNPGPGVFRLNLDSVNPELVAVIGLFTLMLLANLLNWTVGGLFMRRVGVLRHLPPLLMLPMVMVITLTAIYLQSPHMSTLAMAFAFGLLGLLMRILNYSVLPFVIAFILSDNLERLLRQAFSVSGADPWFLFSSPLASVLMLCAFGVVVFFTAKPMDLR
jgi:putative tricarboxylic transport membrane protein